MLATELQLDPTLIGGVIAALAAFGTAVKIAASWVGNLVTNCQADSAKSRDQFIESNTQARKDFLTALDKLHGRVDGIQDAIIGIHEILRERGIPGPADPKKEPHA